MRFLSAIVAAVMLASSHAHAADAGATALAQLKANQAGLVKTLKADLKAAQDVFLAELETFEATVKDGAGSAALTQGLFDDLIALQLATGFAIQSVFVIQAISAQEALATLPGPLNGIYRRGFTIGDGGLADQFRVQVEAAIQKHLASLRKRLAKTTTIADKAGIGLTFRIAAPVGLTELTWREDGYLGTGNLAPAVDTIVTFSVLDVLADGRFFVGGNATIGAATVSIELHGPSAGFFANVPVSGRRWTILANVAEGNYIITVQQQGDGTTSSPIAIGVR